MKNLLTPAAALLLFLPAVPAQPAPARSGAAPSPAATDAAASSDLVQQIVLPNNPATDVVTLYESLTGKRLIRDANLAGPNLSIMIPGPLPRADAIAIIEATLLLNGYSLVPGEGGTIKVLGQNRSFIGESVPLIADPAALPATDTLVSYYMPLRYISAKDATACFQVYASKRPTGSMVSTPNGSAIVITDNSPLIRRLVQLQRYIDVPGARTLTRFVPLRRADAEKVAEMLNKLLDQQKINSGQLNAGRAIALPATPAAGAAGTPGGTVTPPPPADTGTAPSSGTIQVLADTRTNRILIIAPEHQVPELERLIHEMDESVELEQPLERHLEWAKAPEVLPVLESVLAEGNDKEAGASGANAPKSDSTFREGSGGGGGSLGSGGGGGQKPDLLNQPEMDTAPIAVRVGKARIIADPSANNILVFGPPEIKAKADRVITSLDRRPKLIYLSTVIGQLTLGNNLEVGVDYLVHFKNLDPGGNVATGVAGLLRTTGGRDILADPSKILANAAESLASTATAATSAVANAAPLASGLTIYGTIAESVDVYARALETTDRFKVLQRPVIYTSNNTKAVISSGQSVPVPVSSLTAATGGGANNLGTSITSNIQYKDVVLKIEVIPLINSDNEVTLVIAQQNDNILGNVTVSDNQVPIIGTQQLTTTVTLKNRQTIVLGGLITEEKTQSKSGIPLISSIPGLGYLFSTNKKGTIRRELIVMIQPLIVNNEADLSEANEVVRSTSSMKKDLEDPDVPVRRATAVFPKIPALLPTPTPVPR